MLDLSEGKARRIVGEAWALSLSPDGRTLNTTTHDGRVILWDTSSLKKIGEMETKGSFGTSIACVLSPLNHRSNCSLLIDDTLLLGIKMAEYTFSAQRQTEYSTICRVRNIHLRSNLKGHSSTVRSLSFSPGSNYLAATGDSKVISVYDVQH
jgi:superkiller protein 8